MLLIFLLKARAQTHDHEAQTCDPSVKSVQ